MNASCRLISVAAFVFAAAFGTAAEPSFEKVPGVVIDYAPASSGVYVGSPSIAILPNGDYVASHDHFGPKTTEHKSALTAVFRSGDRGRTWKKISTIDGQFWSTLFVHRGALYIMGTQWHYGPAIIRRSDDGGQTWTEPKDEKSGLLLNDGRFHCAPVPVVEHKGRLWRAMEDITLPGIWGICFRAFMMSAPADADLLKADSWTCSNRLARGLNWLDGDFVGWLEGNAVVAPDGGIVDVLRCDVKSPNEKAAIIRISDDGRTAAFDPAKGFVTFPGGAKKFTIRHDPQSKLYWTLATMVHEKHRGARKPGGIRNTLALACSPDLADWTVRCILLYHPDIVKTGFQYVDWQFDGDDIIAACRTAYDDGVGGAHNNHDANFLTFHRIGNFRAKTMSDSVPIPAGPPTVTHGAGDFVITGSGFEMARFDNGEKAFSNRTYIWQDVPEQFRGWRLTRIAGGEPAQIKVKAKRDATLHVTTSAAQKEIERSGWERLPDVVFHYTDHGRTKMAIFRRQLKAREEVFVAQAGWTGTIVLAPEGEERKAQ